MKVELSRASLEALVEGTPPWYDVFNHPLVVKAGHYYEDIHCTSNWASLGALTDEELYELHLICLESWEEIRKRRSDPITQVGGSRGEKKSKTNR